jgi:hypothetical protein
MKKVKEREEKFIVDRDINLGWDFPANQNFDIKVGRSTLQ